VVFDLNSRMDSYGSGYRLGESEVVSFFDEERLAFEQRARELDLRVVYHRDNMYAPVALDEHDVIISDDLLWDLDYAKQRLTGTDYLDRRPPEPEKAT
jgi:hypothetical protein